ncbi:hypothetical protein [Fischerella sp. NIES-3754]|nr:hypothetical protein [Fischerella sp. NIES-3754]
MTAFYLANRCMDVGVFMVHPELNERSQEKSSYRLSLQYFANLESFS